MHYPTNIHTMNAGLRNLAQEPPREGLADISYRSHYQIRSVSTDPGDLSTDIATRLTPLHVECQQHGYMFSSNGRKLFHRSLGSWLVTCPFCDVELGYSTHTLHTYETVAASLVAAGVPFKLDPAQVPDPPPVVLLQSKEQIPLVCTNLLPDGTVCSHPVSQTVNNIQTTIKKAHLWCQGPCDVKRKGKKKRTPEAQVASELHEARGGSYKLVPGSYRMKSASVLVEHQVCGITSSRKLAELIAYPVSYGLALDSARDCPYCHGRSPRKRKPTPAQYQMWLDSVTGQEVLYRFGSLMPGDTMNVPLAVTCRTCGTDYEATERQMQRNVASGCPTCATEALHQQRAWVLEEARELVARRGFVLRDDPGSYIAPADLVTAAGYPADYPTILGLVQAWPATANGFGITEKVAVATFRGGEPYLATELEVLRTGHREQRSKTVLAEELGRSYGSLSKKCRDLGLRFDEREHVNRRRHVDDLFFSVPSPRSSYWAGLIGADGSLSEEVSIEIKASDEGVLQQFMAELGHPGALSYRVMPGSTEGRGLYVGLRLRSDRIIRDLLERYRLTERKSKTLEPPDLAAPDLILGYLCGLLDGDGCIGIDRDGGLRVRLVSASKVLAEWVALQVTALIRVRSEARHRTPRGLSIYELAWHGTGAERLLAALAGVVESPMLRKWQVFADWRAGR
jgi:hypothetical protein